MFPKLLASTHGNGMHPAVRESLRRMAGWYDQFQRVSVRDQIGGLARGEVILPADPALPSLDQKVILTRAIAAHILYAVWRELTVWIRKHPPGLGSVSGGGIYAITELPADRSPITSLLLFSSGMVQKYVEVWCRRAVESPDSFSAHLSAEYAAYIREYVDGYAGFGGSQPGHFLWGISDLGLQAIWATIEVIPGVYQRQFRRQITQAEFRQILHCGFVEEHVKALADGPAGVVNLVEELLSFRPQPLPDGRERFVFSTEGIQLVKHRGELQMAFRPEFMERVEMEIPRVTSSLKIRTGCSARAVAEVFQGFWDWSVALAEAFYIPRFSES